MSVNDDVHCIITRQRSYRSQTNPVSNNSATRPAPTMANSGSEPRSDRANVVCKPSARPRFANRDRIKTSRLNNNVRCLLSCFESQPIFPDAKIYCIAITIVPAGMSRASSSDNNHAFSFCTQTYRRYRRSYLHQIRVLVSDFVEIVASTGAVEE